MKQKIKLVSFSVALVAGALSAHAQTATTTTPPPAAAPAAAPAPAAPSSSWTVTPAFVSQYMFRGVRLGGPAFEPSVEFDSGNLAIGVWANTPITDKVPGQSDPEIDPYGSYTFTVNDNVSIAPGFTWYNYPRATKSAGFYKATFEPNLAVNLTVGAVKFTPKIYYDVVLKGPTYELNAAYTVPLKDQGTELDFTATVGSYDWTAAAEDTTPAVKNKGTYWLFGVAVPFTVSKDTKIIVGAAYTEGSSNTFEQAGVTTKNTAAVGRGVFSLSYAITF
ncbi:MAG: hypothetical protein ACHQ4G_13380 [Opitutales bacterium]